MKINAAIRAAVAQLHLDAGEGRTDAELSAFITRELEAVIAGAYWKKYPQLKARMLVPPEPGIPAGAETVKYNVYDRFGVAKLIASYADDLPRVDIVKDEVRSPIRSFGDAYGYNVDELLAAALASQYPNGGIGQPLDQAKANAARMAFEEKIDRVLANGDSAAGLVGLLNITNALSYAIANGAANAAPGWTTGAGKTPLEILKDLHGLFEYVVDQTNGVHRPTRFVLPELKYGIIATTPLQAGSDTTILEFFLRNHQGVDVQPWYKLKGAGAGGLDRIIAYTPDPELLSAVVNQEFTQYPPQARNLELVVPCKGKCGGVICKFPLSVAYADGA